MKRFFYTVIIIALGLAQVSCTAKGEQREKPKVQKVILISIDTLRPDYLGIYNPEMKTSPNIDQFASDSVVFDNSTAQGPSTAISHKSILYSVYPSIHKTTKETVPTEENRSPLELLQAKGFKTAAFVGGGQLARKFGFAKGFDSYWEAAGKGKRSKGPSHLQSIENSTIDWLNQNHQDNFFLFVHTYEVHCPYTPPDEYGQKFAGWYEGSLNPAGKCGDTYYNKQDVSADEVRYIRDLYAGSVNYVDDFLGRLFAALKKLGIYDDTLIILLSDHGESLGERRYIGHNQLYEVQLKIPLIMRLPGYNSKRIEDPVLSIDVMPTVFEALGLRPPFPFQGRSLLPVIAGRSRIEPDRVQIAEQNTRMRVRQGDWVCIFSHSDGQKEELYNLSDDPEQRKDLARDHPEKVKELKQLYTRMLDSSKDLSAKFVLGKTSTPELDEATKEQLEALGYVAQ
jgi:arylsulfatase A-like enzyme